MNCNKCDTCIDPKYDNCVFYTGPDIPELEIENGWNFGCVIDKVFEYIKSFKSSSNIIDVNIGNTTLLSLLKDKELNIINIIEALSTYTGGLEGRLKKLEDKTEIPLTINAPCLSLPASPSKDDILKATAEKVCQVNSSVGTILADYVKSTEIKTIVTTVIKEANEENGGSGIIQEHTKMPKFVSLPYMGSLSVFDNTGKGIASQGYDKVYICNGNNGTKDLRGLSPIGANINVSGGALSSIVDPAQTKNIGYGISVGEVKGSFTHSLTSKENGPHNHDLKDEGHTHNLISTGTTSALTNSNSLLKEAALGGNPSYDLRGTGALPFLGKSSKDKTGISIASSGTGDPHNTLHPSFGVVWIIHIP